MTVSSLMDVVHLFFDNPSIMAAVVSAIVAFAVLGIDKLVLTPRARRRSYELGHLEKRLYAYGHLVALLRASRKKGEALAELSKSIQASERRHVLEIHDIKALDLLFGEQAHLFSDEVLSLWFAVLRRDKYRILDQIREKRILGESVPRLVPDDLSEMERVAGLEYKELVARWEGLAGIKLEYESPGVFRSEMRKLSNDKIPKTTSR